MKRACWALSWLLVMPAFADEPGLPAKGVVPVRHGYAFDQPDILLRQRLFGLAHGVHLLLSACLDKNENAEAVQRAYDAWHTAQEPALEALRASLAEHHFGAQAPHAGWQDIARVLGLKETIYPALGTVGLEEACATLPLALSRPSYDFVTQLGMTDAANPQQ
ncbi:hypothetical protein [Sulfuricystis multivorans]|uniref:hypothetical protein n=1 Tax=Sulfuricystis multivorans TaxID=2211108 RepID=UPI000F8496C7|nr:hypothetical protein [Sulfuricystis multivorans]